MLDALSIYYFVANLRNAGYFDLVAAHAASATARCVGLWNVLVRNFARAVPAASLFAAGGFAPTRRFVPVGVGPTVAIAPSIEQNLLQELQEAILRLENYLAAMA